MDSSLLILIGTIFSVAIGYFIGVRRGRPVLGAVLGFFLSIIGWIIVAVIPRKQ